MHSLIRVFTLVVVAGVVGTGSASAEFYASGSGSGSSCSITAPCRLPIALSTVTPGGVIYVVGAVFEQVTVDKSVTIRGVSDSASIPYNAGVGGYSITVQAGATDLVTIDNLRLNGQGITMISGGHLQVTNCIIGDQTHAGDTGIRFAPNSPARLSVVNSIIKNNGSGTGGGIVVNPRAGGSARVSIERTTINGGAFGVAADGTGSTAGINMTIANSMISGTLQDGVIATTPAGGAPIGVFLKNSTSANNLYGARAIGPNVTVRLDGSSVVGNGTGLAFSGGGALLSYGNNNVDANGTDGSFSGAVGLK